jgi:hypothetical protein
MITDEPSKEEAILRAMYTVLIDVIKDTTTDPRLRHPLSDKTRMAIRDGLDLITARQAELAEAAGRPMNARPRYVDEPRRSVSVALDPSAAKKDKK